MRILSMLFMLLIVIIGTSFTLLNASRVTINLFAVTYHLPLSVLLLIVFGIGMLAGFFASFSSVLKARRECRQLRREQASKDKEIKELRTIPYKELP